MSIDIWKALELNDLRNWRVKGIRKGAMLLGLGDLLLRAMADHREFYLWCFMESLWTHPPQRVLQQKQAITLKKP